MCDALTGVEEKIFCSRFPKRAIHRAGDRTARCHPSGPGMSNSASSDISRTPLELHGHYKPFDVLGYNDESCFSAI